jgi:hypothetical protein
MQKPLFRLVLVTGCFLLAGSAAFADDTKPQQLPPPRPLSAPPVVSYPVYSYTRVSRYDVWQNYGVSHYGRFRPLVIYSANGPYYRYNHEPFPWFPTKSWEVTPYILGSR